MKLLAINGSPRAHWNTAMMLEKVVEGAQSAGAETELVHLGTLKFSGCVSCFSCKLLDGPSYGRCAVRDDLSPILDRARKADIMVLGAPVYFGVESSLMRCCMERLFFPYPIYDVQAPVPDKKAAALVYTMNIPEAGRGQFGADDMANRSKAVVERLWAPCEVLMSFQTLQFGDYSKYQSSRFDAAEHQRRRKEIFPHDLEKAYDLGRRLVG